MKSEIDMPSKNLQRQIPNFVRCVQTYILPLARGYFFLDYLKNIGIVGTFSFLIKGFHLSLSQKVLYRTDYHGYLSIGFKLFLVQ